MISNITEFMDAMNEYGLEFFNKYYGVYRGVVMDNADPKALGRLKIQVPQIHGNDDYPDDWVTSKGIPTGVGMALYAIPQKGDRVWVSFENGDAEFPIWEYGSFEQESELPDTAKGRKPGSTYFFQTPGGQRLELDDEQECVRLVGKNKTLMQFNKDGRITIQNGNENLKALLKDLMSTIAAMGVVTPSGPGTVNPADIQKILNIQIRLLRLLK